MAKKGKTCRNTECRILPGSGRKARLLETLAGACRKVCNEGLAMTWKRKEQALQGGEPVPQTSFYEVGSEYMRILKKKFPWLAKYHYATLRYVFKYQADAWSNCYAGRANRPRFHSRNRTKLAFTIPERFRIAGNRMTIPKLCTADPSTKQRP